MCDWGRVLVYRAIDGLLRAAVLAALSLALPAAPLSAQQADTIADTAVDSPPISAVPPSGAVGGMGDINLFPKRVVIDGRQRVVSVGLYNRAAAVGDYEITVSDMIMRANGQMSPLSSVTDDAERAKVKTASAMLRWSPRHVSLPGNEAQMVRVMASVPADLPPGEYRSHFTVTSVPADAGGLSIDEAAGAPPASGIGVRIVPRFGIAIPVIVRVGETTLTAGLRDIVMINNAVGKALSFTITREGTRSAFGDITVTAPGAKKPVAEMRGVGVYTEIDRRAVIAPINPSIEPRLIARGTKLTVTYTDDDVAPGKILARQEFVVP